MASKARYVLSPLAATCSSRMRLYLCLIVTKRSKFVRHQLLVSILVVSGIFSINIMTNSPDSQRDSEETQDERPKSPLSLYGSTSDPRFSHDSSSSRVHFRMPDYSPRSNADEHSMPRGMIADPWLHYGTIESGAVISSDTEATRNAPRFSIYQIASLPKFSITQFPRFSIFYQRNHRRLDILLAVLGFVLVGSLFSALLVRIASTNGRSGEAGIA